MITICLTAILLFLLFFLSPSSSSDNSNEVAQSSCYRSNGNEIDYAATAAIIGKKRPDPICSTNKSAKEIHLSYSAYLDSLRTKYKLNKKPEQGFQKFNKSAIFYLNSSKDIQLAASRYRSRADFCHQPQSAVPETSDLFSSTRRQAATTTTTTYTSSTTRLFPKSNSLFVPYKALDSFNERLVRNKSLANSRDLPPPPQPPSNQVSLET